MFQPRYLEGIQEEDDESDDGEFGEEDVRRGGNFGYDSHHAWCMYVARITVANRGVQRACGAGL